MRDGRTGWLVRPGETIEDVTERAIKELADPARRKAIGAACQEWASRLDWARSTARMAELISSSMQYGTSRSRHPGAWIVSGAGQNETAGVLAEGPVLDLLLAAHPGGLTMRPATLLERLLGGAAGEDGDVP